MNEAKPGMEILVFEGTCLASVHSALRVFNFRPGTMTTALLLPSFRQCRLSIHSFRRAPW